ncbi:hypothetical protein [Enterococcus olivae]
MEKNYLSVFFIVGLVFLIIGFSGRQTTFWILGFSFLAIGLSSLGSNKKKNNKKE